MLGRLAERLEAQSLTEKTSLNQEQIDEHDSGTESDDESTKIIQLQQTMANVFRCGDSRLTRLGKKQLMHSPHSADQSRPITTRATRRSANAQNRSIQPPLEDDANLCSSSNDCQEGMVDSGLPSDSDHNVEYHSSEEELEMINCRRGCGTGSVDGNCSEDDDDVNLCNKNHCHSSLENSAKDALATRHRNTSNNNNNNNNNSNTNNDSKFCKKREKRKWSEIHALKPTFDVTDETEGGDSSSDDEVRDLMVYHLTAPVQFRSSPPADAYKPSRYSVSPPPKFMHISSTQIAPFEVCSVSRSAHRKRQRGRQRSNMQRSYLDFDKMRQEREKS